MDNILAFLGLCKKAGALVSGSEAVAAAAYKNKAVVIFTASDAMKNAKKNAAAYSALISRPAVILPFSKEELGIALGIKACALLALTDFGLATALMQKLSAADFSFYESYMLLSDDYAHLTKEKYTGNTSFRQMQIGRKDDGEV